ncbi:ankyrin repeat domain-containing protein [Candidatus Marithrix sp. Canyon 246]|uniref:ankyrin repeat domain-containing protein n=1 Tax=Candidatus Marithrix sp. Canyon 246 TaxID=1827136 RepID=UPI0009F41868|nr:ankyrin repeat domain-containing protein [Candidatus Marithrix sp. Canyon 246]
MNWNILIYFGLSISALLILVACNKGVRVNKMNANDFFKESEVLELAQAVARGDLKTIRELTKAGVNVNHAGEEGMTPLMWALGTQNKQGMQALLELGANPNYIAPNGASAASLAAGAEDLEFLIILLEGGADPNIKEHLGEPALFIAIGQRRWENMRLLLDKGADIDLTNKSGETAIYRAASLNQFEQVAYLIERGANFNIMDATSGTVAFIVQKRSIDPESSNYKWQQKVRQMLEDRGVKFPVQRPWELRKPH